MQIKMDELKAILSAAPAASTLIPVGTPVVVRVSLAGVFVGRVREVVPGSHIMLDDAAKLWVWQVAKSEPQHVAIEGLASVGPDMSECRVERAPWSLIGWQEGTQVVPLGIAAREVFGWLK